MDRVSTGICRFARAVQYGLLMRVETQDMQEQGWSSLRSCAMQTEFLYPASERTARRPHLR